MMSQAHRQEAAATLGQPPAVAVYHSAPLVDAHCDLDPDLTDDVLGATLAGLIADATQADPRAFWGG